MRPCHWIAAVVWCLVATSAAVAAPIPVPDYKEIYEHTLSPPPIVRVPWVDLTTRDEPGGWNFRITVDAQGRVARAVPTWGRAAGRQQALQAVKALRFKPFEREGRATPVRFQQGVRSVPEDYVGPADRRFPSDVDPAQVRIALQRTTCFGSCPDYWVEVRGDGQVSYRGSAYVVVSGEHHWKVAPEAVAELLERLRQADYFHFDGYYVADVSDNPTYVTRVSLGQQKKFVLDYAGNWEMPAVPGLPEPVTPRMPKAVTAVEDAIDTLSGVLSWVEGDENTMTRLREAHWNFRSQAAGRGLRKLVGDCKVELAMDFIRAGAPLHVKGKHEHFDAGTPLVSAARCGSTPLVRLLESKGALAGKKAAQDFLAATARSGYPQLVTIALKHDSNVQRKDAEGETLIAAAAQAIARDEEAGSDARFDPVEVIKTLIAAGADPNARDKEGNAALHKTHGAAIARVLIAGGADVNVRNAAGETPLFNKYFAETKPVLIQAGADVNARDPQGRTALFGQRFADSALTLVQSGADVNAQDLKGRTPLESTGSEEVALVLLDAGAVLPKDSARLTTLIDQATARKWEKLLPLLQRAAETPR